MTCLHESREVQVRPPGRVRLLRRIVSFPATFAQGTCDCLLTLSSDIYRYAESASVITFEHFSSKYLSSKDSDRRILRSPKMRVQLQQRRKSDGMGDGIEESRQRKHSPFQYFERAIDERVGVTEIGGEIVVSRRSRTH